MYSKANSSAMCAFFALYLRMKIGFMQNSSILLK